MIPNVGLSSLIKQNQFINLIYQTLLLSKFKINKQLSFMNYTQIEIRLLRCLQDFYAIIKIQQYNNNAIEQNNQIAIKRYVNFSHIINNLYIQKSYMNLFFENPRIVLANNNRNSRSEGPFIISRDQSNNKPVFKHSHEWSEREQIRFVVYFSQNQNEFAKADKNQQWEMFKTAAKFIRTRNYTQCKNHYSKNMKMFGSIRSLIVHLNESFVNFQQQYQCYLEELQTFKRVAVQPRIQQKFIDKQLDIQNLVPTDDVYQGSSGALPSFSEKICSMPHSIARKFYPQLVIESEMNMSEMKVCFDALMVLRYKLMNMVNQK